MNIEAEFETVDIILATTAPTRGVDAFALALIKAERQVRKLFTHLIFQFPAFGEGDISELRAALGANHRVYFEGFLRGFNALYPRSAADLIGADYARLEVRIKEAIRARNKIFHGQLTGRLLRRSDLVQLVSDIRAWCTALGQGTAAEFGYDGFGRNSFQKSAIPELWRRYRVEIITVQQYDEFIRAKMQRP